MDSEQFREFGKTAVDIIADYFENIRERDVLPSVEPGDVIRVMPESAPENPEHWKDLISDFDKKILPAITHWISPQFHSYFPCGVSYASVVGSLLCNGLGIKGQSWLESPACTELEVVVVSWLAKLMGLPEYFLNSSSGPGGGVIQNSASESTLVCLLAAKNRLLKKLKTQGIFDEDLIKTKFVIYTSDQSNSSVEKAGALGAMITRLLKSNDNGQLQKETLLRAFKDDKAKGYIPCYVVTSLGTTGTCAFDPLDDLGPICREEGVWLHVDAAYAGTALICPEYKHLLKGIEFVDSFVFNPHKWLLVNLDCSVLWVKDSLDLIRTCDIKGVMDTKENDIQTLIPNYRYWQIPASRRFRALKLWFVLKIYGAVGIRNLIRTQISLAEYFANLAKTDKRLIIEPEPSLTVVCFRLRKSDNLTQKLLEYLVSTKKIFMVAATLRNHYIIRFVICSQTTTKKDVDKSWKIIRDGVDYILSDEFDSNKNLFKHKRKVSLDVERI